MKRIKIVVQQEIIVEFDEQDKQFQDFLLAYQQHIHEGSDEKSLAEDVALSVARYGVRDFIEGVGYVKHYGDKHTEYTKDGVIEHECLINVEVDVDLNGMVDYYTEYIEEVSE